MRAADAAYQSRIATVDAVSTDLQRRFMDTAGRLPTLYELDAESDLLLSLIDTGEADLIAEAGPELALVEQLIIDKVEGYIGVIRTLESMAAMRKAEADRLRKRSQQAEHAADWLRARLLEHMRARQQQRIETGKFTVTRRDNPLRVDVLDASQVPHQFERTTITTTVDKAAVLAHVKSTGEVVPGVSVSRGESVRIS